MKIEPGVTQDFPEQHNSNPSIQVFKTSKVQLTNNSLFFLSEPQSSIHQYTAESQTQSKIRVRGTQAQSIPARIQQRMPPLSQSARTYLRL